MQNATAARAGAPGNREAQTIRYWMSIPPITINAEAQVSEALALMHERSIRRLPVVSATGVLCGIITDGDIRGANILHTAGAPALRHASGLNKEPDHERSCCGGKQTWQHTPDRGGDRR